MQNTMLLLQLLLAVALAWSAFGRMVKMNEETHNDILLAIWFEFVASMLVFGAPFLPMLAPHHFHWAPFTTPDWIWLVLLVAAAAVQIAASRHWSAGQPEVFKRK